MSQIDVRARIDYPAGPASQPVLYPLSRDHEVRINIRRAEISETGGFLDVELTGEAAGIEAVLAALRARGCRVEVDRPGDAGDGP